MGSQAGTDVDVGRERREVITGTGRRQCGHGGDAALKREGTKYTWSKTRPSQPRRREEEVLDARLEAGRAAWER